MLSACRYRPEATDLQSHGTSGARMSAAKYRNHTDCPRLTTIATATGSHETTASERHTRSSHRERIRDPVSTAPGTIREEIASAPRASEGERSAERWAVDAGDG